MKYDARACHFNMDTGCVELLLRDGRMISINNNQEGDSFCCHPLDRYLFFPRFGFLSDIYNLELVQNAGNCRNQ